MSEVGSHACARVAGAACRAWVGDFRGRARGSVRCFRLGPFLSQVNWLLRFLTVRAWDPLSSLEPLPVLIKVPKQEGLVVYQVL